MPSAVQARSHTAGRSPLSRLRNGVQRWSVWVQKQSSQQVWVQRHPSEQWVQEWEQVHWGRGGSSRDTPEKPSLVSTNPQPKSTHTQELPVCQENEKITFYQP